MCNQIINYICFYIEYFFFFFLVFSKKLKENNKKRSVKNFVPFALNIFYVIMRVTFFIDKPWHNLDVFFVFLILFLIVDIDIIDLIYLMIFEGVLIGLIKIIVFYTIFYNEIVDTSLDSIMYMLAVVIMAILFKLLNHTVKNEEQITIKFWAIWDSVIILLLLVVNLLIKEIDYIFYQQVVCEFKYNVYFFAVVLILSLPILILKLYRDNKEEYIRKRIIEIQIEEQKKYYELLLDKENETRKFRHDIINDFLSMKYYLENNELEKLSERLDDVLENAKIITNKCYDVGNDEINIILNYYFEPIKEKYDITVKGVVSNELCIKKRDVSIICGNIIKNSVEAIQKTEKGIIVFEVREGKDYLRIKLVNSFSGTIEYDKTGLPKTQKKENKQHGIGIKNVKKLVEKYNGKLNICEQNDLFCIEIFVKKTDKSYL